MTQQIPQERGSHPKRPTGTVSGRAPQIACKRVVKVATKCVRVWRCPKALARALPDPEKVPRHKPDFKYDDIDSTVMDGLEYITFRSCSWHVDWEQIFQYIVVRGSGTLWFDSDESDLPEGPQSATPKRPQKVHIEVGDIIQLWGFMAHRGTCCGSMTLLNDRVQSKEGLRVNRLPLVTMLSTERMFAKMLKKARK